MLSHLKSDLKDGTMLHGMKLYNIVETIMKLQLEESVRDKVR